MHTETSIYRTDGIGPTYSFKGAFVQVYRLGQGNGQMDLGSVPIVVPGAGVILINAGRIFYDNEFNVITLSGNQQLIEEDFGKLCAAFR